MKGAVIFQIGRLERGAFERRTFVYQGTQIEADLSGLAVAQVLGNQGYRTNVCMLFPISLPFNASIARELHSWRERFGNFVETLESTWSNPEPYLENPDILFEKHPHVSSGTQHESEPDNGEKRPLRPFAVIPAFGVFPYQTRTGERHLFTCRTPMGFIQASVLAEMLATHLVLERQATERLDYFCDVSSGLNVQTTAMAQAFRDFVTCVLFQNPGQRAQNLGFYVLGSVAVGPDTVPHHVECHSVAPQAFFDYPVHPESYKGPPAVAECRDVFPSPEDRSKKRMVAGLVQAGARAWASIYFGLPLALVYQDLVGNPSSVDNCICQGLWEVIERVRLKSREAFRQAGRDLEGEDWSHRIGDFAQAARRILFALSLYRGICRAAQDTGYPAIADNGIEAGVLKTAFEDLCRRLGARYPRLVVGRELEDLPRRALTLKLPNGDWVPGEVILGDTEQPHPPIPPNPRNILAHAGLERTLFECCLTRDGRVCLRYRPHALDSIWSAVDGAMKEERSRGG